MLGTLPPATRSSCICSSNSHVAPGGLRLCSNMELGHGVHGGEVEGLCWSLQWVSVSAQARSRSMLWGGVPASIPGVCALPGGSRCRLLLGRWFLSPDCGHKAQGSRCPAAGASGAGRAAHGVPGVLRPHFPGLRELHRVGTYRELLGDLGGLHPACWAAVTVLPVALATHQGQYTGQKLDTDACRKIPSSSSLHSHPSVQNLQRRKASFIKVLNYCPNIHALKCLTCKCV